MMLLVGLGNPDTTYAKSRHNLGFMVIDALGESLKFEKKFNAEIGKWGKTLIAKPHTFMNNSGEAIQKIVRFYKIKPKDVVIIHDDKDMVFGKIRVREKGSSGGHRGVQSIIDHLKTEKFTRIKIGIANNRMRDTVKFVLAPFSKEEQQQLKKIIPQVIVSLKDHIKIK